VSELDDFPLLAIDADEPFAILADLHANLEAVQAVAAWLERAGVRAALILGDLIGYGASPQPTLDLVRAQGWQAIRGNHEDMLIDLSHVERTRELKRAARRALEWTREHLDADALRYLADLPLAGRVGSSLLTVHGSLVDPRHCYAYIYEFSIEMNAERLRELDAPPNTVVCFGHTHHPVLWVVTAKGCIDLPLALGPVRPPDGPGAFLNPGSVGFPRDRDPRASFAVYDPRTGRFEFVRLPYDVGTAARKIEQAAYDPGLALRLLRAR